MLLKAKPEDFMAEVYQAAAPPQSSPSKTTWGIVVVYHFLIAALLVFMLALWWARSSPEDVLTPKEVAVFVIPMALVYFITGWGILKWKGWGRKVSLVLNWLNVVAAVVELPRIRTNSTGVVGVLLSCLVLWWLSVPTVKLKFRRGIVAP
jgi:hypothetical protein